MAIYDDNIYDGNLISEFFYWIESSKEQHLFETEIFCNITNVFTVTFD